MEIRSKLIETTLVQTFWIDFVGENISLLILHFKDQSIRVKTRSITYKVNNVQFTTDFYSFKIRNVPFSNHQSQLIKYS